MISVTERTETTKRGVTSERRATKQRGPRYQPKRVDHRKVVLHATCAAVLACVHVALPLDAWALEESQKTTAQECIDRAEVKAYLEEVQSRVFKQWIAPAGVAPNQKVVLRLALNHNGSIVDLEPVGSNDPKLAASFVKAVRAAGPFPVMSERVSCFAGIKIAFTFTPPSSNVSGPPQEGQSR
jgi:hypothetical protein